MASTLGEPSTCAGCGSGFAAPATGATGSAVCPNCGAPLGDGPGADDTAAFRRFYTGEPSPPASGWRAVLRRIFGRNG